MATQTAVATFTGVADTVAVTYPAQTGVFGTNFGIEIGAIDSASSGQVVVDISGTPTTTGCTVRVSDPGWVGSVTLLIQAMP
jgi:hypothetical protein